MKYTFNERLNQGFNFTDFQIGQIDSKYWVVTAQSSRFGREVVYEDNSFLNVVRWIKRNSRNKSKYSIKFWDYYNPNKQWSIVHYADGHYTLSQVVKGQMSKTVRIRKQHAYELVIDSAERRNKAW